jgi:HSP20 family protein|tara:strand:+ start:1926 stop:2321 length:396 start_codon:yes stop_codon:yes gene_type:complete
LASLFGEIGNGLEPVFSDDSKRYVIPIDVVSNDDYVTVTASLPGVSVDNVDVSVEDGVLTINNKTDVPFDEVTAGTYILKERIQGLSSRSIRLPKDADVDSADVSLKDGILTIQFKNGHPRQVKSLPISTT